MSHPIALRTLAQSSGISEDDESQNNNIFSRNRREKHSAALVSGRRDTQNEFAPIGAERAERITAWIQKEPIR